MSKLPRSGDLRHLVDVETPVVTKDSVGQPNETWTVIFPDRRVFVRPLRGREFYLANQQQTTVTHRVWMRPISGTTLTPRHRLNWKAKGRILNIVSVIDIDEEGQWLELMCLEDV